MAEDRSEWRMPEDTSGAKNPPDNLLSRKTRRRALLSYLGPVILLFVVVGIALIYWANRSPAPPGPNERERDAVGTAGAQTPGGFNPAPEFDRTRDELKFRGGEYESRQPQQQPSTSGSTLTSIAGVKNSGAAGHRVELEDAEVASVDGGTIWARDGDSRIAIIASGNAGSVKPGSRIDVSGTTEVDQKEGVRIRASKVESRQ